MTGESPDPASRVYSTAVRHHQAGRLDDAEALYRQVLDRRPDHPGALHLLGVLAHQRGDNDRALALIDRALALNPHHADAHNNRGIALRALGRLDEAVAAYQRALQLRPDYPDALSNLGIAFHQQGHLALARACLDAALRLQPDHTDALFNLGNVLLALGRPEEAIPLYHRAVQASPRRTDLFNNLGNALLAAERIEEAIAAYRRAVDLDPGFADGWSNLAVALERQDRHTEAARCLDALDRLRPGSPWLRLRRAALCPAVFPSEDAIAAYRAAFEATLDDLHGANLPWDDDAIATKGGIPSFNLAHHGEDDRRLRTKFAAVFRDPDPRPPARTEAGPPRIGFVVTHSHEGIFVRCTGGLINHLTPGRFRIVVFGSAQGIEVLRRSIRHPDVSFLALPEGFAPAVAQVREAGCDLLYHWEVGTDPLNYFLPFARPAPVQCTSWGVQVTTGVPAIDWYLSSALVESPEADAHYSERLVRLPCLLAYQHRPPRPDPPPDRAEFGLPADAHLYACLQRPLKLHPRFDALLAGILRRDPRGLVVLLKGRTGEAAAQVAERHRTTLPEVADRIVWRPWQPSASYHRLLGLADVVLDPVPYGVGSSAYDIFAQDLPLVTLPGPYNAGRYAQACYRRMGVMDLVAATPEEYINFAVRLGTDRAERAAVRARIAAASGVLFEDTAVVREHELFWEETIAAARL